MLITDTEAKRGGRDLPLVKLKQFLREQEKFLAHMDQEIVDIDEVAASLAEDCGDRKRKRRLRKE